MINRSYEASEKLNHLKKADEFVKNGGSYRRYAIETGIPSGTFYGWLSARNQISVKTTNTTKQPQLINLGKTPPAVPIATSRTIIVSYYGATIEVTGENALRALLKNIRAASD